MAGGVLVAISIASHAGGTTALNGGLAAEFGVPGEDLPERTAAMLLRALGLSAADAGRIVRRPLPPFPPQASAAG